MHYAINSFIVFVLTCMLGVQTCGQLEYRDMLDKSLLDEIESWRKGDEPPLRLLNFPEATDSNWNVIGSHISEYVGEIRDSDLLKSLLFHPRTQPNTFHAAASRLVALKGTNHVSRLISEQRKTDPSVVRSTEFAVLSQLLCSPYLAVQVARIAPEDMRPEKAEKALKAMKVDLEAGASWSDAYRKHSDLHPDLRDRESNPRSVSTLIGYLFDSTVSPSGFDIETYDMAEDLPIEHLRELFRVKQGAHILNAADGVYLYHIKSHYEAPAL